MFRRFFRVENGYDGIKERGVCTGSGPCENRCQVCGSCIFFKFSNFQPLAWVLGDYILVVTSGSLKCLGLTFILLSVIKSRYRFLQL